MESNRQIRKYDLLSAFTKFSLNLYGFLFFLHQMSSVPISQAYISKLSKTVKSKPKPTPSQLVRDQIQQENKHGGQTLVKQRNGARFWNDCKVCVVWESESVRVQVESKAR